MLRLALVAAALALAVDARASKWHDSLLNVRNRVLQATPSPSPSPSPSAAASIDASPTSSVAASPTSSVAATPSTSMAATVSVTGAVTPSNTGTGTGTGTSTATSSMTATGTATGTMTSTGTPSTTPQPSSSVGASVTRTNTPSVTGSTTPEGTRSATRSGSRTPAPTRSAGASGTGTPSVTATGSSTNLPSRSTSQTPRPSQSMALVSLPAMIPAVVVIKQTVNGIPVAAISIGIALELRRSFCYAVFSVALRRGLPPPPCTMTRICTRAGTCVTIEILVAVNIVPIRFLMESGSADNTARLLPDMRFANFPRELQTSTDSDLVIDYSMEVEAPNTAVDNTGDGTAIVAAQQTQANALVAALQDTAGTSALAAAMQPAVVDAALAAGVTNLDGVGTSVDTTSAQVTVVNPRAPSDGGATGLSGGAIAGIVIAVLVVTGLVVGGVFYGMSKSRKPVAPAGGADGGAGGGGGDGAMV